MAHILAQLDDNSLEDVFDALDISGLKGKITNKVLLSNLFSAFELDYIMGILVRKNKPSISSITGNGGTKEVRTKTIKNIVKLEGFAIMDHNIISQCNDINISMLLLRECIDLHKVTIFSEQIKNTITKFILEDTLKVPINPNFKVNDTPLWRLIKSPTPDISILFMRSGMLPSKNFSQQLDINATGKNGNTHMHLVITINEEYLALNPDHTIKNNDGETPLEYRKRCNLEGVSKLEEYAKTKRITELECFLRKSEEKLEKAQAEASGYKSKLDQLSALL